MKTLADFAAECAQVGKIWPRATLAGVEAAALTVKKTAQVELAAAGVGSGRLRGVGRRGAKIGVRYDLLARGYSPKAIVKMFGPAHLLERDTRPHRIPRMRGPRARQRFAVIPGVGVRAYANHPGTRGKHPWAKAVHRAAPLVSKEMGTAMFGAFRKIFT